MDDFSLSDAKESARNNLRTGGKPQIFNTAVRDTVLTGCTEGELEDSEDEAMPSKKKPFQ